MPTLTSANVAQAIPKIIAVQAMDALVGNLLMGNLVNQDYSSALANAGDVVNIPIPGKMTANVINEGGSVQTQNPSLGNASVTLDRHIEASFTIPDVTKALTQPDLIPLYLNPAIIALAEKVETDCLSLFPQFTANPSVGAGNTNLGSEAVIDAAETTLFNAKVPESMQRNLIVTGQGYSELRQIQRFTENQTNGNGSAIQTGLVGRLKGFNVYRSQYVQKVSTTTYNLAFVRNAISLVVRRLPSPMPGTGAIAAYADLGGFGVRVIISYNPNTLSQQFTVDMLYGVASLRQNFAVNVLS